MSRRQTKVSHELRDRLAEIIGTRVSDPRLVGVSVTSVDVSPDFSFARVFYRPLEPSDAVDAALQKAKGFIRRELAERVHLKRIPELDFRLDTTADTAARVEEILDGIKRDQDGESP